ncbi:oligosaccharide flippase family protein [Guptibacillus algicola]|uniref:oligosaccharide flippase family protein n=1 Tax=Guptibacillus algicola TaxID=225844 RepID=UPI001CD26972|nr:oligosaccharide flippase family protein [Alkalihalobacillus algicola]MCA0987053.1 oligosaccharide flippase family protein [Alkalihalobacillus algicola]
MIKIFKNSVWNIIGTFVVLLSGALITFAGPKVLSIEEFGMWRTFILYAGYAGVLHFGIVDGYLLNNVAKTDSALINASRTLPFLVIQQIIVGILIIGASFLFNISDNYLYLIILIIIFSVIINIRSLIENYFVVLKDFRLLNIVKILEKIIFICIIVIFIYYDEISYMSAITIHTLSAFIVLLIMIVITKIHLSFSEFKSTNISNIKVGYKLLFSNSLIIILFFIDSVIINVYFSIKEFAIYSFALAIIMLVNQVSESLSQVFFPYLSTHYKGELRKVNLIIKKAIFVIWIVILQFTFLLYYIIERVFPEYSSSKSILIIYFVGSLFSLIIRVIQNNTFKIYYMQKQFIKIEIIVLCIICFLSIIGLRISASMISISIVILCSRFIWYLLNELAINKSFKNNKIIISVFLIYSLVYISITLLIDSYVWGSLIFFVISLPIYFLTLFKLKRRSFL